MYLTEFNMIDTSRVARRYHLMRLTFQGIPERRLYRGVNTTRRIVPQVHKSSSWLVVGNLLPYQAPAVTAVGLYRVEDWSLISGGFSKCGGPVGKNQ